SGSSPCVTIKRSHLVFRDVLAWKTPRLLLLSFHASAEFFVSPSPSFSSRRAFTLVELLVVIAIIGTLVALLLPAVQSAREASRRSTCASNIRNIALATLQYEERFRSFPGLFDPIPAERLKSQSGTPNITWA